jgi:RND family efflux transporter MFP subunit
MSWTQIKAPSSGKIAERAVDPGTAIFPGTPLFVIESTVLPQVLADIPTEQADRLRIGMAVGIRSTDKAGMLNGKLSEIIPQSNPATHSVQFKVDLGSNAAVSSGQFVTVEIPEGTRPAILVPHIAIRHTGQLTGVFVVDAASKARFRLVKSVPFDAARAEILSGVEPGENIIAELSDTIIDGISVENRQ